MDVNKAKRFITDTARPLELAEYRCIFEGGPRRAVAEELKRFQNPDGGFGNALEPDNWNPGSTPITTNDAIIRLHHCGALGEAGDMAEGIARWLRSGEGFLPEKRRWAGSVASNLLYPHAVWWEPGDHEGEDWNPTVSLAAFMACVDGEEKWKELVGEAFRWLESAEKIGSDEAKCFILAHGLLELYGVTDVIDLEKGREAVRRAVGLSLCRDVEKYGVDYAAGPSAFFCCEGYLPAGIDGLIKADLGAVDRLQMEDGGYDITWQWHTPYEEEFRQAREWWRPRVTMEKLGFYLAFKGGEL